MKYAPAQEAAGALGCVGAGADGNASSSCVGRRDVPGPSTDFSVTDGLWWIGNHNSATRSISQNGGAEQTR
ncbi:hypothetical protein [Mycobacterium sp.]|uniref:hypothetical protein n=1 Tax=Mycobacterium sp. TaxID=1785 RepID=UPI002D7FD1C1|nr:hypothetical protein [Mycobacterium sp.]